MSPYTVELYRNYSTGKSRWAVLHNHTGTWYFAERYGRKPAERLCRVLGRDAV